jgi:hypothetical protein
MVKDHPFLIQNKDSTKDVPCHHIFSYLLSMGSVRHSPRPNTNNFQGIKMRRRESLTHLFFVDDILIFCYCAANVGRILKDILTLLYDSTEMNINMNNFVLYFPNIGEEKRQLISNLFNFPSFEIGGGLK